MKRNIEMNISRPIASQVGGVSFGLLTPEEIRALSVKRVQNPDTFDTLLHPVPGGLYDLSLGAFGDNLYVVLKDKLLQSTR